MGREAFSLAVPPNLRFLQKPDFCEVGFVHIASLVALTGEPGWPCVGQPNGLPLPFRPTLAEGASLRLVAGNDVDPVNLDLIPNYDTIFDDLKDQPYNTVDGVHYGVPHGRGANVLIWNTDEVKPNPTSWGVILDPNQASKYKGKISVYDDPVYIADAAVYLCRAENVTGTTLTVAGGGEVH